MSAIEYLKKAVEYDMNGRQLESLKLYQSGISALLEICKSKFFFCLFTFPFYFFMVFILTNFVAFRCIAGETDPNKKLHFQKKIDEYMTRAEQIKVKINELRVRGEIVDKIHIIANGTGYGYETIFGKYLNDSVKEVSLEEPYLREYYQVKTKLFLQF